MLPGEIDGLASSKCCARRASAPHPDLERLSDVDDRIRGLRSGATTT